MCAYLVKVARNILVCKCFTWTRRTKVVKEKEVRERESERKKASAKMRTVGETKKRRRTGETVLRDINDVQMCNLVSQEKIRLQRGNTIAE